VITVNDAVTIRVAELADLPAILRIYSQPAVDAGETLSYDAAKALYEKFSTYPSYDLYIACVGSDAAGTFGLLIMDNLAHLGRPSAIIEDVAVDPQFQRRGIGRKMIEFAMNQAKAAGCYKLMLSAASHRREAHEFYESLGFSCHGYSFHVSLDD
jgi:ribosomal protein S18 acetylase RimI-like enzyme